MSLGRLLSQFINAHPHTVTHAADPLITNLVFDSREVTQGSLFFALPGVHTNGNKFIAAAIEKGARAVVYEGTLEQNVSQMLTTAGVAGIQVENARFAMSPVSASFFSQPSQKLVVIGVTGTEGKSSTVSFIWQLLRLCGKKAGFISTVQYSAGGDAIDNSQHQTTPEAPIVQSLLFQMAHNGCEYAVIEASSHGLSARTNRLGDVFFDAAVMMNVTHEHLEFHGTWEQYRDDKANLFRALLKHSGEKIILGKKTTLIPFGVVNADDPSADFFKNAVKNERLPVRVFGFSVENNSKAHYIAHNINAAEQGISFNVSRAHENDFSVAAPLPGAFNAGNVLVAIIVVSELTHIPVADIAQKTRELVPVRGRMTRILCGQPFEVIVDYAHTPSSFSAIFPAIKARAKGKIICVFGSGGERDTAKRPEQGKIASRFCDIVILADEDPRGEDPVELLLMIEAGCLAQGKTRDKDVFIIHDRQQAIRRAFSLAQKNDIVLLLGKAHENSIIYKDYVMPYDEIVEAKSALNEIEEIFDEIITEEKK